MKLGQARQIVDYSARRLRGLPPSPFAHIQDQFRQLFTSPSRVAAYRQAFAAYREVFDANNSGDLSRWMKKGVAYFEKKLRFAQGLRQLVAGDAPTMTQLYKAAHDNPAIVMGDERIEAALNLAGLHGIEGNILTMLFLYTGHDGAHTAPGAITVYGFQDLDLFMPLREHYRDPVPGFVLGRFRDFVATLDEYFDYYEHLPEMGEAFFTPRDELSHLSQMRGDEIEGFAAMIGRAFALRFLGTMFNVTTQPVSQPIDRHTLEIAVDPALREMCLPRYLLAPKLVGGMKNFIRIVWVRERNKFRHDENDPERGLALFKIARGEPVDSPVHMKISAQVVDRHTWELRISDDGKGVLVNELFQPLVKAIEQFPGAVAPALARAALAWQAGNPYAFNDIPLGDLLESVYHFGVSTGTGSKGSGIGLWGSLMMLFKLGAKLRVGITPGTGGFFESVILPMNLGVSPEQVARSARLFWHGGHLRQVGG